jgi:hypothetical protein
VLCAVCVCGWICCGEVNIVLKGSVCSCGCVRVVLRERERERERERAREDDDEDDDDDGQDNQMNHQENLKWNRRGP